MTGSPHVDKILSIETVNRAAKRFFVGEMYAKIGTRQAALSDALY